MSNRRKPVPDAPGGSMGDMLEVLEQEGHLTERQRQAVTLFWRDLNAWYGGSEGMVMGDINDRVQLSRGARLWPPGGSYSAALSTFDCRLNRLRGHERRLMARLVKHRELVRGTLADFGRAHSAYKTRRDQRAVAVGRIGAFLDTLADEYLGPVE